MLDASTFSMITSILLMLTHLDKKLNMDNIGLLSQQVEMMYGRLAKLYRSANNSPASSLELLPAALKELGVASEKMQMMMQEITRQNEQLIAAQKEAAIERQRYQNLFALVPDAYLVTDLAGIIQEANYAAATLFNTQPRSLVGKPLVNFVEPELRPLFQSKRSQLAQRQRLDFSVRFQPLSGCPLDIALTVSVFHDQEDGAPSLRWLLRDITERKRAEAALEQVNYDPSKDRPTVDYSKGDMIPIEPQVIWLVCRGVAKLTTLSDGGDEVLVGLAGKSMVFGASLTVLETYQATALTDMRLVSLPQTEIAQSPQLTQVLLTLINQRLRQTESFLAIYGHIRVEDRLNRLLQLLKQEVGEPTEHGIRLSARLTHQDLASACCTTRVTITRLLNRFQQQGTLAIDSQNHLVLKA